MTIMMSGILAKQPEQRTSSKGNVYATTLVRTGEGDDALFANVTAFGSLADTLVSLAKGDSVTIIGNGKIGTYEARDGSGTRASLSVTASRLITLVDHQAPPRPRTARQAEDRQQYQSAGPREFAPDPYIGPSAVPF